MRATVGPEFITRTASGERGEMRAILQSRYGNTEVLQLGTAPRPEPGEREVLIAVKAAGLDRGTWHLMTGRPYLMRLMGFGFRAPKHNVPGLDVSGTVIEVGPGVTRFRVGDEVFGIARGSFAAFACAQEDKLARKPARLSFDEAAVLGVSGLTALQAIDESALASGERVLIVGASGGVGSYAVQIAHALGAHVTAVCSGEKMELVRSLGADQVLDYRTHDFTAGAASYDVILDIGGGTALLRLRRILNARGRLVFVGNEHGGDFTAGFGRPLLAMLIAPFVQQRFVMLMVKEHHDGLERLAALADEGKVRPAIDRRASLAQLVEAMRDLEAGRIRGKVAINVT